MAHWVKNLTIASQVSGGAGSIPGQHSGLNNLTFLQLWLRFILWPGNFICFGCGHKKIFFFSLSSSYARTFAESAAVRTRGDVRCEELEVQGVKN